MNKEEEILAQQVLLDRQLKQRVADVDPSFMQGLNFKLESKETLSGSVSKPNPFITIIDNSRTLLKSIRSKFSKPVVNTATADSIR